MLEARCPECGYRFGVDDEAEGLSAECPHCAAEVLVPTQREVELPLNQTIPPPVRQHTVAAEPISPVPTAAPDEAAVEAEFARVLAGIHARIPDAITPPTRSFAADAWGSPQVLLAGPNRHMKWRLLAMNVPLALIALLLMYITTAQGRGQQVAQMFSVLIVFAIGFFPVAWLCGACLRTCAAACAGDDATAIHVFSEGIWEDLLKPLGRMFAAVAVSLLPVWLCLLVSALYAHALPPVVMTAALAIGLFLFPAAVLVLVLGDSVRALSPGNVFRLIFLAPLTYLATWAAMAALGVVVFYAFRLAQLAWAEKGLAYFLGIYLALLLMSTSAIVAMRVIGLMYRHFKDRLPIGAE